MSLAIQTVVQTNIAVAGPRLAQTSAPIGLSLCLEKNVTSKCWNY